MRNAHGLILLLVCSLLALPPCTNQATATCTPTAAGLVSWWQGEGNGWDVFYTNNASLGGYATFANGAVGQAFSFDGQWSWLFVPASVSLDLGSGPGFTIEGWISPLDVSAFYPLLEWNSAGASMGLLFGIDATGNGCGSLAANLVDTGLNSHLISSDPDLVQASQWQHVALTYDKSSGVAALYRNGSLVANQTLGSFAALTYFDGTGYYDLWLGGDPGGNMFPGQMDEISLYNRALTAAEIQAVYNAGGSGKCGVSPAFVVQPASQTAVVGNDATFYSWAMGTWPLACQWYINSSAVPDATNSSLTVFNVQSNNAGAYTATCSNAVGLATCSNTLLSVAPAICVQPLTGLVSWWQGEGDGTDVFFTNNANLSNVTFTNGKVGQAFSFNGTNAYGWAPASPSLGLDQGSGMTIECWINPAASGPLVAWSDGCSVVVAPSLSIGNDYSLYGNIFFWYGLVSGPGIVQTGTFQHVAFTYDNTSGDINLYWNGAVVASGSVGSWLNTDGYDLLLGANSWDCEEWGDNAPVTQSALLSPRRSSAGAQPMASSHPYTCWSYYTGLMDEVAIYDHALTATEIQAIYNASVAGRCPVGPTIVQQPVSQDADEGANVTFSVGVTGTAPMNYQWTFNGTAISGATNAMYNIPAVQTNNAGTYTVTAQNQLGATNSTGAVLTVIPAAWLIQYFGTNYLNNPNAAPGADPDGDGWTNLQEYRNGTDPTVVDQPLKVLITRPRNNSIIP